MRFVENGLDKAVFIRQSWLNDFVLCPERSRFKLVKPDMSGPSDATIMGTAVHYGIEGVLLGDCSVGDMTERALTHFHELRSQPFKQTNLNPDKYELHIESMCRSWIDDILPQVQLGGQVEFQFRTPLGFHIGDWPVWIEGTMDYVQPDGVVWDWKTASRAYNARDRQSTSIQATVYTSALNFMGLTEYPAEFRYGIMIRQDKPKSQVISLMRNSSHHMWLVNLVRSAMGVRTMVGTDNPWPMNDTSALCSERWCPYWSICKGAFLSPTDLEVPSAVVDLTVTGE